MQSILRLFLICACGVALGGASAWYSIRHIGGYGAIQIGEWIAYPFAAADEIDPYTVAKSVADGSVPLGIAEGLAFETDVDSQGTALNFECDYSVEGTTPPSRLWTLVAYNLDGFPLPPAPGGTASLYSGSTLRFPDGSFLIQVSPRPKPGNWLAPSGKGRFRLVLRVYDTSVTANSDLSSPTMPIIRRLECGQ